MKFKLRDYQLKAKKETYANIKSGCFKIINWMPTGCLTGDTIINLNRGGWGFSRSLESIYLSFNQMKKNRKHNFDKSIPTKTRSDKNGIVGLNEVLNVVYCGKKQIYKLTLSNDTSIKATENHKFLTRSGYKKLSEMSGNDFVAIDQLKAKKGNGEKIKINDTPISNLKFHPFAVTINTYNKSKTKKVKCKRIEMHRGLYEASINKISFDEYKFILRNDKEKSKNLIFIDPKIYHIHHKNHDHKDNSIDNLEKITVKDHLRHHGIINFKNFNQGMITFLEVVSIEKLGVEDTYDMCCAAPHNNYVANGMIVHNSGKGLLMSEYANDALSVKKKILVVLRRRDLIFQTRDNFKKYHNINASIIMGKEKGYDKNKHIQIASIDTLRNAIKKQEFSYLKDFDLVIQDESQDSTSPSYQKLFDFLGDKIYIGFTATPYAIGNKPLLFWDKTVKPINPTELVEKGHLTQCKCFRPEPIDTSGIKKANGDYKISDLFDVVSDLKIVGDAIDSYRKYGENKPFIGFCVNKAHSKLMAHAFNENGIPCIHLDESHSKEERSEAKRLIENGTYKGAFNVNIWSTGFDCPILTVMIGLRPTLSEVLAEQQPGRVFRPYPGKEYAIILDHANNTSRFGVPLTTSHDNKTACLTHYALDYKKQEERKDDIKVKDCPECFATIEGHLKECPYCGFKFVANEREIEHENGELTEVDQSEIVDKLFIKIDKHLKRLIDKEKSNGWKPVAKWFMLYDKYGSDVSSYIDELGVPKWIEASINKNNSIKTCSNCKFFRYSTINSYDSRFMGYNSKIKKHDIGYCAKLNGEDVKKSFICIKFKNKNN